MTDGRGEGTDAPGEDTDDPGDETDKPGEGTGRADELTHTTDDGAVQMVDVGGKPESARRAVATGEIRLRPGTVEAIRADEIGKGDVLATARVGAIQAVKHTWETIPMCHQLPVTNADVELTLDDDRVRIEVAVETTARTGCEMEALQGVTTGLATVWDMVKATEKDDDGGYPATSIGDIRVVEKEKRPPG